MYVCMCVFERERQRETDRDNVLSLDNICDSKIFKRKRIVNQSPDFFAPARMPYGGSVTIASNISV